MSTYLEKLQAAADVACAEIDRLRAQVTEANRLHLLDLARMSDQARVHLARLACLAKVRAALEAEISGAEEDKARDQWITGLIRLCDGEAI